MQKKNDGDQSPSLNYPNNYPQSTPPSSAVGIGVGGGIGIGISSPGSEKRQRKTLLIQKQRLDYLQQQAEMNGLHGSSSHGGGGGGNSRIQNQLQHLELEVMGSESERFLSSASSSTYSSSNNRRCRRMPSSGSNNNGGTTPLSRRMKRFVSVMFMAAIFCLLGVFREQVFNRETEKYVAEEEERHHKITEVQEMHNHHEGEQPQPQKPMTALGVVTLPPHAAPTTMAKDDNRNPLLEQPTIIQEHPGTPTKSTSKPVSTRGVVVPKPKPKPIVYPKAAFDPSMELQPPALPTDTSNNHSFVRQYCDLQGTDWFPIDKDLARNSSATANPSSMTSWHQRAPFVLLLGPTHGGSDMLWQLLSTHPQMADAMQTQFFTFNHKLFVKQQSQPDTTTTKVRIRTRAARQAYMARHVATKRKLKEHPSQIVLDHVPETLLYEHIMAPMILCVMPWVKIVISVRHPLKRLLQQYQTAQQRGLTWKLEDWIARDLERMTQAGLLVQDHTPKDGTATTTTNDNHDAALKAITNREAWERYQQLTPTAMEASVGQSLYEAMVQPWFQWMEDMGRNPQTEIVVVQQEVYVQNLEVEYARLLRQLGLVPHSPPKELVTSIVQQAQDEEKSWKADFGDAKVRRQLKHFFQPYNKLFGEFLTKTYQNSGIDEDGEPLLRWEPDLWKTG